LVPLKDPVLESYFKRRYPHTARVTSTAARMDRRTLNAGRDVGRRLVLSQPVAEIGAAGGLLPPAE
jgi:2-polyprenyl-6-methoxyphenol hydroxylase-like FAD-dependent oxidoreductase